MVHGAQWVHRPRKRLRSQRARHLSRPIVVRRISCTVQRVGVSEWLHETVELRSEPVLKVNGRSRCSVHRVPLAFPPFGPPVFEPYPDSGLCEVRPHGYLFPGAHVRISVSGERGLQFLELLRSEMRPLSPLPFRVFVIFNVSVFAVVSDHANSRVYTLSFYTGSTDRVHPPFSVTISTPR